MLAQLDSWWHRFNKVLETFLRTLIHIVSQHHSLLGCTSRLWISHCTTSQRCSTGLRSSDCQGCYMQWNYSYSRNYLEMVCHPAGSSHPLYSHRQGRGEQSSFDTNVPRKSKLLPHYDQHEAGIKSRLDPCFHGAYAKRRAYCAEIKIIRPGNVFPRFRCSILVSSWQL